MEADQIKILRNKLGLSQTEFAHKVGVTVTMVSAWERGTHAPRQAKIVRKLQEIKEDYFNKSFLPSLK